MHSLPQLYLAQLKQSLMNTLNRQVPDSLVNPPSLEEQLQTAWFDHFWFGDALTMCSLRRLDNIQFCGSPGIPVVTGQSSLSHRAKLLEILG